MDHRSDLPLSGRRAEATRNDRRVLDAARAVFVELGPDASVATIARRAGVGVGTLYRRYATKEELVRHLCIDSMQRAANLAEEALAKDDVWSAFVTFMRCCLAAGVGGLSHLAGTFAVTGEVSVVAENARDRIQAVIDRTHASGPLRPGVTAADVCTLLQQLLGYHAPDPTRTEALRRRYLAVMLDGLRGDEPLPGKGASWEDGARLWHAGPVTAPAQQ